MAPRWEAADEEFLLRERVGLQGGQQIRGVDGVTCVFVQEAGDEIQQVDVHIAASERNGSGVGPAPLHNVVQRNDPTEETDELPAQFWQ